MRFFISFCFLFIAIRITVSAQSATKIPIDTCAYGNWLFLDWSRTVSNDGKYFSYVIGNTSGDKKSVVVQDTNGEWKMELPGSYAASFTQDNRFAVIKNYNDSLAIINLNDNFVSYIPNVESFNLSGGNSRSFLLYKTSEEKDRLILRDLHLNIEREYSSVINYYLNKDGKSLMLLTKEINEDGYQLLQFLTLGNEKRHIIWKGTNVNSSIVFDQTDKQCAFIGKDGVSRFDQGKNVIWYYKIGEDKVNKLVEVDSLEMRDMKITDLISFSNDGRRIYYMVTKNEIRPKGRNDGVQLNIWSYTDKKLQSAQLKEINKNQDYIMSVAINGSHRGIMLAGENEFVLNGTPDNFGIVNHKESDADFREGTWNIGSKLSYYLVSVKSGDKKLLFNEVENVDCIALSPDEKLILYYDKIKSSFFCYNIANNANRVIMKVVEPKSWINYYKDDQGPTLRGGAYWLENNKAVLLFDRYDLWQLDPLGINPPVNLTNNYGQKHNIIFSMGLEEYGKRHLKKEQALILNAFNTESKENGFYKIKIGEKGERDPELLTMGAYFYQIVDNPYVRDYTKNLYPIKAKNKDRYIVARMSATEAYNYFSTTDFRYFTQLSDLQPHKKYNWYTTELHTWKSLDGIKLKGILYKPEDFDPRRKYPLIVNYYERRSDLLNCCLIPEDLGSGCVIDIPTYVSNGYLVFTPDIHFEIGRPMDGTYNAIMAATNYLSKFSFVNEAKIGIQGCSFGGIQTNYLVTHTNKFAAACSASGMMDLVSAYGDIYDDGYSLQSLFETGGQLRMGGSLWQNTDQYLKYSAILKADKVTTPFLLMHTTNDGECSISQAIAFFTALRRLGKKAWLLEYNNADHGVFGKSGRDFSIRMRQFFDHYLKDMVAPRWMTRGISARMKGIDNGLDLDQERKNIGIEHNY